ncbi:MAG TPA: hypothetical protein VFB62_06660, partial [Polyangiaceae bacterium]|nr:hypothetical protein [Polyangiaceae bacterium]
VDLGSRSIRESSLGGLSDALESAGFEPDNPGWFDASRSVRLGATQEVQFGFHWNDDEVEVVEIEPETARLCRFPTFEAWFRAISGEDC